MEIKGEGKEKHERGTQETWAQCTSVGKWLEEIASDWTSILQFLQHLFKILYWDTEQNLCGWTSGTSPSKRPNAISHLCLLVLCTKISCAVIVIYVCFGYSEFCFSPVSICIIFSCLHCIWAPIFSTPLNLVARNLCSPGTLWFYDSTHWTEGWRRESEIGKATWRGKNQFLKRGVRCFKELLKTLLYMKLLASFLHFRRSLQRSKRSKSCFAYTTDWADPSTAIHISKVSRKQVDVSRQPVLETHTYTFCFISCLSPQFHY